MASPKMQELNASIPKGQTIYASQHGDICFTCGGKLRADQTGLTRFCSKECRKKRHG